MTENEIAAIVVGGLDRRGEGISRIEIGGGCRNFGSPAIKNGMMRLVNSL